MGRISTGVTGGTPNLLGSLTAAARPLPEDADWKAYGVAHKPEACGLAFPWQKCTAADSENPKPLSDAVENAAFVPFMVEYSARCDGPVGVDMEDRARRGLQVRTSRGIAQVLSSSTVATDDNENPNLPDLATDITPPGGPSSLRNTVMGLLQDALACGLTGELFLHAPAWTLPAWLNAQLIEAVGNVYKMGPHTVVLEEGYTNDPPSGKFIDPDDPTAGAFAEDGEAWIYVSGPVEHAVDSVQLTTDTTKGSVDPRLNQTEAIATRLAIYRFDPCCVYAALADLTGVCS